MGSRENRRRVPVSYTHLIACLEEIAYLNGWIKKEEVLEAYEVLKKNQYGKYLKDVLDGKYIENIEKRKVQ